MVVFSAYDKPEIRTAIFSLVICINWVNRIPLHIISCRKTCTRINKIRGREILKPAKLLIKRKIPVIMNKKIERTFMLAKRSVSSGILKKKLTSLLNFLITYTIDKAGKLNIN